MKAVLLLLALALLQALAFVQRFHCPARIRRRIQQLAAPFPNNKAFLSPLATPNIVGTTFPFLSVTATFGDNNNEEDSRCARIDDVLAVVSAEHARDVAASLQTNILAEPPSPPLVTEKNTLPFEEKEHVSVIETTVPLLDHKARQTILHSAANFWNQQQPQEATNDDVNNNNSRFTLQGPNKREVHVSDLPQEAIETINVALQSIYPLLRQAFGKQAVELAGDINVDSPLWSLLLYDALVIEYDATQGNLLPVEDRPAQPLHRDLGLFSVNIALDDPSEFQGGGTVFERLLLLLDNDNDQEGPPGEKRISAASVAILPRNAGHAVAHPCRERHAGGALISGRRTILVLFVTATNNNNRRETVPQLELAARCKGLGMKVASGSVVDVPGSSSPPLSGKRDQITCYRSAIQSDPNDGEAWLYLAMALMSSIQQEQQQQDNSRSYEEIIKCLEMACQLNPADGRIHNTLGIAYQRKRAVLSNQHQDDDKEEEIIRKAFGTAASLHTKAAVAGCKGAATEARSALLNLGLWHANRDDFESALPILRQICIEGSVAADPSSFKDGSSLERIMDAREFEAQRVVRDAHVLLLFCEQQVASRSTTTSATV